MSGIAGLPPGTRVGPASVQMIEPGVVQNAPWVREAASLSGTSDQLLASGGPPSASEDASLTPRKEASYELTVASASPVETGDAGSPVLPPRRDATPDGEGGRRWQVETGASLTRTQG